MGYYLSYICRNLYEISEVNDNKCIIGYIDAYLINNNTIELLIEGLHKNGYYVDDGQAIVIIDYPKNAHIYDVIITIFDKLIEDHEYKFKNIKYKDVIICSDELLEKHPEKCNYDRGETYVEAEWIPFTKDTVKYVDYKKESILQGVDTNDMNVIRGKVEYNQENQLEFTYDDPIVSIDMSKEYYEITRKRIVWDIERDQKTMKYYVKPYCFADINQES